VQVNDRAGRLYIAQRRAAYGGIDRYVTRGIADAEWCTRQCFQRPGWLVFVRAISEGSSSVVEVNSGSCTGSLEAFARSHIPIQV